MTNEELAAMSRSTRWILLVHGLDRLALADVVAQKVSILRLPHMGKSRFSELERILSGEQTVAPCPIALSERLQKEAGTFDRNRYIARERASGRPCRDLAAELGMSAGNVCKIAARGRSRP